MQKQAKELRQSRQMVKENGIAEIAEMGHVFSGSISPFPRDHAVKGYPTA